MKRKIITCDVCGADITNDEKRYKFKKYQSDYVNWEEPDWAKWNKLDMCESCYQKFIRFVTTEQRERKSGAE